MIQWVTARPLRESEKLCSIDFSLGQFFLLTKILIMTDLGSCYKNEYEKSDIRERASTFYIMRLTARVLGSVVRGCRPGQCRK
uniref:Uncharacterized protein n=1 Tax=Trichogramma kaykai TaxID=54128 RepID=A0ABD2WSK3_9HYME